jgi:hypothetical protein
MDNLSPGKLWARDMERNDDKRKNKRWMASNATQRNAVRLTLCRIDEKIDTSAEDGRFRTGEMSGEQMGRK